MSSNVVCSGKTFINFLAAGFISIIFPSLSKAIIPSVICKNTLLLMSKSSFVTPELLINLVFGNITFFFRYFFINISLIIKIITSISIKNIIVFWISMLLPF